MELQLRMIRKTCRVTGSSSELQESHRMTLSHLSNRMVMKDIWMLHTSNTESLAVCSTRHRFLDPFDERGDIFDIVLQRHRSKIHDT